MWLGNFVWLLHYDMDMGACFYLFLESDTLFILLR